MHNPTNTVIRPRTNHNHTPHHETTQGHTTQVIRHIIQLSPNTSNPHQVIQILVTTPLNPSHKSILPIMFHTQISPPAHQIFTKGTNAQDAEDSHTPDPNVQPSM